MVLRMLPPRLTSGTRSSARTIRLQSILAVAAETADALTAGKAVTGTRPTVGSLDGADPFHELSISPSFDEGRRDG